MGIQAADATRRQRHNAVSAHWRQVDSISRAVALVRLSHFKDLTHTQHHCFYLALPIALGSATLTRGNMCHQSGPNSAWKSSRLFSCGRFGTKPRPPAVPEPRRRTAHYRSEKISLPVPNTWRSSIATKHRLSKSIFPLWQRENLPTSQLQTPLHESSGRFIFPVEALLHTQFSADDASETTKPR